MHDAEEEENETDIEREREREREERHTENHAERRNLCNLNGRQINSRLVHGWCFLAGVREGGKGMYAARRHTGSAYWDYRGNWLSMDANSIGGGGKREMLNTACAKAKDAPVRAQKRDIISNTGWWRGRRKDKRMKHLPWECHANEKQKQERVKRWKDARWGR